MAASSSSSSYSCIIVIVILLSSLLEVRLSIRRDLTTRSIILDMTERLEIGR